MGVPKFFRWLSERYPKINQRAGYLPDEETCYRHFDKPPPVPLEQPDPLSTCGLPPPIDRLYIDMNGIIHGCSHKNSNPEDKEEDSVSQITNKEIFRNVCFYLDRIVGDIAKPTELIYMAIDGVAPRAKLNQQRSRRYRSSREGMIERTVYEAHMHSLEQARLQAARADADPATTGIMGSFLASLPSRLSSDEVQEVEPGRYAGKFETEDDSSVESGDDDLFHSNSITPGTPFFEDCTRHIEHFIRYKLTHDPKWQHLTIIFSGPNVPGEGEHKIMEFIRKEKYRKDYNPNLRHCIMGQDGDLIMLGLVTHEPNLVLLREQVIFEMDRRMALERHSKGVDMYIYNANFEWLHMNILRDYLAFEFETRGVVPDNEFDLEPTIDDFVFLTFFVGNDFLPHMPALDIADEAFELLFATYKRLRWKWLKDKKRPPYLTNSGDIVSGKRLEQFLSAVGSYEDPYHYNKESESKDRIESWRKQDKRRGFKSPIPDDTVIKSKEMSDRAKYREMLKSIDPVKAIGVSDSRFAPVFSGSDLPTFKPTSAEQDIEESVLSRIGNLLQYSVSSKDKSEGTLSFSSLDDSDTKGRYYFDKFGFTPFDAEKHIALRKAYIEGLVWTLKYYYQGVVSWDWYYPYHYGPMISDLVNIEDMLKEIAFDEDSIGEPLRPFEQLMGCMPPSSANALPEPYRWLLTDQSSPIIDFYPRSFTVDMNGKRWPWEAVVLLPFIDSKRLVEAARTFVTDDMLSDDEKRRNGTGHALLFARDESFRDKIAAVGDGEGFESMNDCKVPRLALSATSWNYEPEMSTVFRPELVDGVAHPLPGFPSLRSVPIERLVRRRIGVNVFGLRSRYRTAILELADALPEMPPAEAVANKLIGTTVQFNFPFFLEGFVTAVSSSEISVRGVGSNRIQYFDRNEIESRKQRVSSLIKSHLFGENLTGSGGWKIPAGDVTVSVRPFQGFKMTRDGSLVKTFAKFEVELPLIAAVWGPCQSDPRSADFPVLLEKDPYFVRRTSDGFILTGISVENESRMDLLPNLPEVPLPSNVAVDSSSLLPAATKVPDYPGQPDSARKQSNLLGSRGFSRSMSTAAFKSRTERRTVIHRRETFGTLEPAFRRHTMFRQRGHGRGALLIVGVASVVSLLLGCDQVSAVRWPGRLFRPRRHIPNVSEASCILNRGGADTHTSDDVSTRRTSPPPLEFAHGTTTISFVFKDGIVAAVDSRASLGNFVGSKTTQKVLPVNSHILGTMAGGAADCSFWIRKLKAEALLHELTEGKRMTVARASRLLSNVLYNNRGLNLSVGTMIMGIDPDDEKPRIYYVDNSGVRIAGDVFAVGSGATFALGILDTERQPDMTEDEAIALGIKAIRHATFRDAYSGGFIGVYLINKNGWRKVFSQDLARSPDA